MTLRMMLMFAGAAVMVSCGTNGDKVGSTSDASGIYVREYAIEINNPESGKKIGMRQVRDSIFIERGENGYQVSNRKWRMNDYDQEGWVSMAHSEDRPIASFLASYDEKTSSLIPMNRTTVPAIFIDKNGSEVYKDNFMRNAYRKVN